MQIDDICVFPGISQYIFATAMSKSSKIQYYYNDKGHEDVEGTKISPNMCSN